MTLGAYAKNKGMNKEEYKNLKSNLQAVAIATIQQIPASRRGHGMYYPINELIPYSTNEDVRPFILQELKNKGIETIEGGTLWRI